MISTWKLLVCFDNSKCSKELSDSIINRLLRLQILNIPDTKDFLLIRDTDKEPRNVFSLIFNLKKRPFLISYELHHLQFHPKFSTPIKKAINFIRNAVDALHLILRITSTSSSMLLKKVSFTNPITKQVKKPTTEKAKGRQIISNSTHPEGRIFCSREFQQPSQEGQKKRRKPGTAQRWKKAKGRKDVEILRRQAIFTVRDVKTRERRVGVIECTTVNRFRVAETLHVVSRARRSTEGTCSSGNGCLRIGPCLVLRNGSQRSHPQEVRG